MKIDTIVTAVNTNSSYLQLIPFFIYTWRTVLPNVNICIILVADEIPLEFLHYKNFIILHRETRAMSTAYLSQILRIFYPCLFNNVRGAIMTTDIDMFPIKRSFFENAILENEQDCFVYLSSNKDWATICYCIANNKIWKELMNVSSYYEMMNVIEGIYMKNVYEQTWWKEGLDETYLNNKLKQYALKNKVVSLEGSKHVEYNMLNLMFSNQLDLNKYDDVHIHVHNKVDYLDKVQYVTQYIQLMYFEIPKTMLSINYLVPQYLHCLADHFIDLPDHINTLLYTYQSFDLNTIQFGDVVYIKCDLVDHFIKFIYPTIHTSVILLSGVGDTPVIFNDSMISILNDDKLIAWAGHNILSDHPKIIHIPYGVPHPVFIDHNILNNSVKNRVEFNNKNSKVFIRYMSITHISRLIDLDHFSKNDLYTIINQKQPYSDYLQSINENKFALAIRGSGYEIFSFWETLLMGSVPILLTSCRDKFYSQFPCIIVNSYDEINKDLLYSFKIDEIKLQNVDKYLKISEFRKFITDKFNSMINQSLVKR
jgi:hypothetical protein